MWEYIVIGMLFLAVGYHAYQEGYNAAISKLKKARVKRK